MFTLVSLGILMAAIVGGFMNGLTTQVIAMFAISALFAIAGSITTAAYIVTGKASDK